MCSIIGVALAAGKGGSRKTERWLPPPGLSALKRRNIQHTSKVLDIPENIELFFLLPATPEMNPIEQIWKELRLRGFRNEVFPTLDLVVDRLCDTICSLTNHIVKSITCRSWILCCFY